MAFQLMSVPKLVVEVMLGAWFIDGIREIKEEIKNPERDAA
ncbi:MAG: hypothetical protein WAO55_00205 [Candidatus Manganitrophaceae bacterium]